MATARFAARRHAARHTDADSTWPPHVLQHAATPHVTQMNECVTTRLLSILLFEILNLFLRLNTSAQCQTTIDGVAIKLALEMDTSSLAWPAMATSAPESAQPVGSSNPVQSFSKIFSGNHKLAGNYRRMHHFHERISQFLLMESAIPDDKMLRIAQSICDGSYKVLNK